MAAAPDGWLAKMTIVAEQLLDLAGVQDGMMVRLFLPRERSTGPGWTCRYEIDEPIGWTQDVHGESSLQALSLALKSLSATLYGSALYRAGKLGAFGELGGYLGLPAPNLFLDEAPYPF